MTVDIDRGRERGMNADSQEVLVGNREGKCLEHPGNDAANMEVIPGVQGNFRFLQNKYLPCICICVCIDMCVYVHMRSEDSVWKSRIELRRLGLGTDFYSLNPGTGLGASILMLMFVARIKIWHNL